MSSLSGPASSKSRPRLHYTPWESGGGEEKNHEPTSGARLSHIHTHTHTLPDERWSAFILPYRGVQRRGALKNVISRLHTGPRYDEPTRPLVQPSNSPYPGTIKSWPEGQACRDRLAICITSALHSSLRIRLRACIPKLSSRLVMFPPSLWPRLVPNSRYCAGPRLTCPGFIGSERGLSCSLPSLSCHEHV